MKKLLKVINQMKEIDNKYVFVQTDEPENAVDLDIWVDTNDTTYPNNL